MLWLRNFEAAGILNTATDTGVLRNNWFQK